MKISVAIRALAAFSVGVFITFSQSHSADVGLIALAIFTAAIAIAPLAEIRNKESVLELLPLAVVALLIAALATLFIFIPAQIGQIPAFISLVTAWGLVSGALELFMAGRSGFRSQSGKDFLISAAFALALGVLFLIVELDIVSAVGFLGAYLALSGVHLGIAAFPPAAKKKQRNA